MADAARTVEETTGDRVIVREYDAAGKLLRIVVRPLPKPDAPRGPFWQRKKTQAAPPPAVAAPAPEPARSPNPAPPEPEPLAAAPPPAKRTLRARFRGEPKEEAAVDVIVEPIAPPAPLAEPEPPAPEPIAAPIAPEAPPEKTGEEAPVLRASLPVVHTRFLHDPRARAGIDVIVEPLAPSAPIVLPAPAPIVEAEPMIALDPEPAPIVIAEPEPEPIRIRESEPIVFAQPEIALEPEPTPMMAEPEPASFAEPEPAFTYTPTERHFEILAIESLAPIAAPEPEPEVVLEPLPPEPVLEPEPIPVGSEERVITLEPEPEHAPPAELEPSRVVVLEDVPAPEPAPAEPEPAPLPPEPPASYVAIVPDVDDRVDALISRPDVRARRRKRAPIPAPVFAPLAREPWEERLDAALSR